VCKLLRSLYGLKQAGRIWSNMFTTYLLSWGFTRFTIDSRLYTYSTGAIILWVLVWVDDAVIVDNDYNTRDRFVNDMPKRFPASSEASDSSIVKVLLASVKVASPMRAGGCPTSHTSRSEDKSAAEAAASVI